MRAKLVSTGLTTCVAVIASLAAPTAMPADTYDTFMHIDGITGDSNVVGHVGDIVLSTYSQTFATKACSKVVAVKFIDSASPLLISRAAGNVVIPNITISLQKPGDRPFEFFKAILDSVVIDRIDVTDVGGPLTEQLVLRPRGIRIEYRPQKADGSAGTPIITSIECS